MALPANIKTTEQAHRFIGGRRQYNFRRKMQATRRRFRLANLWAKNPHMCKADLARALGVSRATISRDVQKMKEDEYENRRCPVCRGHLPGAGLTTHLEILSDAHRKFYW